MDFVSMVEWKEDGRVDHWKTAAKIYDAGYTADDFKEYEHDGVLKQFEDEETGITEYDLSVVLENLSLIIDDPSLK